MAMYRTLSETSHRILKHSQLIETTLADLLQQRRAASVLEVGFGRGRALLELANFNLPEIFFYDATRLHFDDESLDLIYSVVTVRFINRPRCVLKIEKHKSARLNLQLTLNAGLSVPMEELPYRHGSGKVRSGFRSVYDVSPEFYRALFEQGRLSRAQLRTDIRISDDLRKLMPHEQD